MRTPSERRILITREERETLLTLLDLSGVLGELYQRLAEDFVVSYDEDAMIAAAQKEYANRSDGAINVDDDAVVSWSQEQGSYVAAWVWVRHSAAGLKEEER